MRTPWSASRPLSQIVLSFNGSSSTGKLIRSASLFNRSVNARILQYTYGIGIRGARSVSLSTKLPSCNRAWLLIFQKLFPRKVWKEGQVILKRQRRAWTSSCCTEKNMLVSNPAFVRSVTSFWTEFWIWHLKNINDDHFRRDVGGRGDQGGKLLDI